MKYSFIAQYKKTWPVDVMCRLMGINRNSYYSYQRRQKNRPEDPEHQEKLEWIKKVAEASQHTYGGRRMRKALNALGYPIGIKKPKRLMQAAGVFVRYRKKYKVTTNSKHSKPYLKMSSTVNSTWLNRIVHMFRTSHISTLKKAGYTWLL